MAGSEEGRLPANPFDSAQREGRDKTVKWCLWEVLAKHYENGARVADLQKDERLLELRPKMRAAKNLNGQARRGCTACRCSPPAAALDLWPPAADACAIAFCFASTAASVRRLQITGELGSDKGVHFIKDFNGQPGYWGVRLDAPTAGERPAGGSSAEAQQQSAGGEAALPPPQRAPQQVDQQREQHPADEQTKQAARSHKAAIPSPPVPGNESEAAPWAGATCQYLTDRLWKKGVAVWWPAEQQYFNGKIIGQRPALRLAPLLRRACCC